MRIPSIEPLEARIAPAVLSIAGPVSVAEGNTGLVDMTFHVLLDTPSPTPLSVKINTVDGSATVLDGDYNALTNFVLSIPANTVDMPFVVKVKGDTQFEPGQTFSVVLSEPSAGHSLGTATGTGTILADTDVLPKLSVSAATRVEGNAGFANMEFTVSLTNAASEAITFEWGTQTVSTFPTGTQSATAGEDYTAVAAGTVGTIAAGATSVKILVPISGDVTKTGDDLNELFAVGLQNAKLGATALEFTSISSHIATGTILNDEPTITLDFASGQSPVPNEGTGADTTVNFIVKLSVAASDDIVVDVSTLASLGLNAATAGVDYTAIDGSSPVGQRQFTITKGQTQITVPVKVKADAIHEMDEAFGLQIDAVTMLGAPYGFVASPLFATIKNDESVPTVSLKAATLIQPASGSVVMNFPVTLSGPADRDITFTWSTEDLTGVANAATEDVDYTKVTNQTATILAGQTSVNLPVTIFGNGDANLEQFRVNISTPSLGTVPVGGGTALGTIRTVGPTISVLSPLLTTTEGSSGADRDAVFRITRGGTDINTAVVVRVSTVDGTATAADGDYDAVSNVLVSLPAGVNETTFVVKVNPDTKHESNEMFALRVDSLEIGGASYVGIGTATADATIVNDDAVPTISISDTTVVEKSTGVAKVVFVVTLSNPADRDIAVNFVTELDGTAMANPASAADFSEVTVPRTITIKAGQTSASSASVDSLAAVDQIDVLGDTEKETAETFLIKLSNASFGTIADDTGKVTITDDEPVITLTGPTATAEGSTVAGKTNFTFTVRLDKAAQENIAVRVSTVDGTALAGSDYDALVDKWVIVPAGNTTATFVVAVLHDLVAELTEAFTVNVNEYKVGVGGSLDSNGLPTGGVALPQAVVPAPATGTITDDDVLGLSINDATIIEGNAGSQAMTFTVSIPKQADRDVTFTYQTANNSALAGEDFTGIVGGTATIPVGSTSVQITVDILGDLTNEADQTFTVSLSNAFVGTDVLNITDQFGTGTIFNDERKVSIQSALTVAENVPGGIALVTVSLLDAMDVPADSTFPVTVTISLTNGTAKKGSDFFDPASLNIVIPAGQTSATISVALSNDVNFEANETFDVYLIGATNALIGTNRGTVTIDDDDTSSKLSISDVTVTEGNPSVTGAPTEYVDMTFTVTLDKVSGAPITFDWETLTGAPFTATPVDDFIAVAANTVTIPANTLSKTFVVKVLKDLVHEFNETVGVRIFNVVDAELLDGATVPAVTTERTVTGTISNDESVPTISILDLAKLEGAAGTTVFDFTVTLSRAADRDVTFLWRTAVGGINAGTEGTDYTAVSTGTLVTILAGQTSTTVSVDVIGDLDLEQDETFLVQIVDPRLVAQSAPHVIGSGEAMTGGDRDGLGTIRRDEITATIAATASVTEGNDVLSTPAEEFVEVHIPVTLSEAVPAGQTIRVGFKLNGGTGTADGVGPSDARRGVDFIVPTDLFITFAAGEITKDIIIKVRPDAISELDELFTVRLDDATSQNVKVTTGTDDAAVVTIVDDEVLPVISVANVGALENAGTMTFVIRLSHAASTDVTVKVETLEGTALSTGQSFDFTGRAQETITFAAGETSKNYVVEIRNDADGTETVENFSVHLSAPTNGTLAGGDATGTIVEPNFGSLKITDVTRVEGSASGAPATMTFTVTRAGSTVLEAMVDYAITFDALLNAGVTAAEASDFAAAAALSGTVTIPAGATSATIQLLLEGDALAEGDEAFKVTLSNLRKSFAVADADLVAKGTIVEDDVTVAFIDSMVVGRPKVFSQAEGNSGSSDMSFGVTLNQVATTDVVVTFSVGGGTAESGSDFTTPTILTVTIPAGQLLGALVIPILGDEVAEGVVNVATGRRVETFTVNVVSATVASVVAGESVRTGEIVNDDATFRVLGGATVIEGNSGTSSLVFTVELTDAAIVPGTEYSVDFATSDVLAIAGQDYTATTGTLTFTANGTQTISVPVTGDTASENDETLRLTISNSKRNTQAITAILDDEATGTIQDDEAVVSISNATLTEGDAGSQQMLFIVSLPAVTQHPVVIRFITVDGTAVGAAPSATDMTGRDFRAVTAGEVTIPTGQLTAQIAITVFGDLVNEAATETFTVKLVGASGGVFGDDEGLGTINEDVDPVPTISIGDAQIVEGDSGTPKMKFRVALSQPANADVVFKWNTITGTAGAADFTEVAAGTVATIPVGALFIELEVDVSPDVLAEGNETFKVAISEPRRGTDTVDLVITNSGGTDVTLDATGSILDDDAFVRIKASDAAVTFVEDNGAAVAVGTKAKVMLDAPALAGPFSVTYTITPASATGDVAAGAGTDYVVPTTFTKQFAGGAAAADLFIDVDLKADAIDEWAEKFVVTLVGVSGAKLDATGENLKSVVTITDNDDGPSLQMSDILVQESNATSRFTVRLIGNVTERNITIHWDTVAGTALAATDYADLQNQTLVIPAGAREGFITVAVVNDTLDEADEEFRVSLEDANFTNGTTIGDALIFDNLAVATIAQNDLRTVTVTGGSVVEGAAIRKDPMSLTDFTLIDTTTTTKVKFTIRLDAAPSSTPVKVNFTTVNGTAVAGVITNNAAVGDFTAQSGQAVFLPGQTTVDVFVDIISDNIAELDETFKLAISLPSDGFAILSGSSEATGSIEADESVFQLVRVLAPGEAATLIEGDGRKATFRVLRTGASDIANFGATVFYSVLTDSTAGVLAATVGTDFVAKTGSITFAAGETDSSAFGQFIEVEIQNDTVAELNGEKFIVRLTNVTHGVVSAVAAEAQQTVVIDDGSDLLADPTVVIEAASAAEGQALSFVVKLVRLTDADPTKAVAAQFPITVSFNTRLFTTGAGVFATAGDFPAGFSQSTVQTLVFAVGEKQKTISVATQQDAIAEQDETMKVSIIKVEKDFDGKTTIFEEKTGQVSPMVDVPSIDAVGTIRNEDTVITVSNVAQPEGSGAGTMTFTATIPVAVSFPVSFHYKTKNGTGNLADYTAAEGDVTILAGQTAATFTVATTGDTIRETDETFIVDLTAAKDSILAASAVTGTLTNDDAGPQLTVSAGQVGEGDGDLVFTVSLTGEITSAVTVDFATSDGTAHASGVLKDYLAQNGTLTFAPQAGVVLQTRQIRVAVNGDDFKEGDETVNVALSSPFGAEIVAGNATGTILDGVDSTVGVFVSDSSAVEGGAVVFTFELTSLPSEAFTINVNTRQGSANGSDFGQLLNREVSFSTSSLTASVTVTTGNDDEFEPTERFFLDIDAPTFAGAGVIPGGSQAQAVIFNNDQRIISAREFEFIDEDGDLVNVRITKGALLVRDTFGELQPRGVVTLTPSGTVGGMRIDSFNFLGTGREFEGASLFVTRKAQAGFDRVTDGQVNVGEVIAAQTGFAQLVQGVNLGTVKIDGDLGKIVVGSTLRPVSIKKLDVGSLGVVDRSEESATQSVLFGRAGSIIVRGDVEGSMFVVGSTINVATGFTVGLGSVGSLTVTGKIIGGADEQTGYFNTNAGIGKITVGGIVGGEGVNSGKIEVSTKIGSFTALGDVIGGGGVGSGQVIGSSIGKVEFGQAARGKTAGIKASIIGGEAGPDTALGDNQILRQVGSGAIVSFSTIGSVKMNGDIRGGAGDNSGMLFTNRNVSKFTMADLIGGEGDGSGRARVLGSVSSFTGGTIQGGDASNSGSLQVSGKIGKLTLANVLGFQGDSSTDASRAGSVLAGDIGTLLVTGKIKAATDSQHIGGGSIFSGTSIGSLTVKGSVEGTSNKNAVIAAGNNIGRININTLKFAEILAGYQADETNRGALRNADAQIGVVVINDFIGSSIVAGVAAGSDGLFGQEDDTVPAAAFNVANNARIISRIASVTIKNLITDDVLDASGIVAQRIGKVIVDGARVSFGEDPIAVPNSLVFINKI